MANTPVRQYIGARYVPTFANPTEWDNTRTYEPLTIVQHQGNSYTSRQYVPTGIDILNTEYWANTGNYNAQIEQYRHDVEQYKEKVDQYNTNLSAKLETVSHDDTLTGTGKTNDPLKVNNTIKTTIEKYNTRLQKNYVLLGDSWTVVHNNTLFNTLKKCSPNSKWYNYGINGSVVQKLPQQINNAKQDTTLKPEEITDVIIVIGTNNVFWKNLDEFPDITEQSAYDSFKAVKDYFPNANIHYFPNNSKTLNEGRNSFYRIIINAAIKANIIVHVESLYWLAGHLDSYNGNDQEGVQHLSDSGYTLFAYFIYNIIQGGNPFYLSQWIQTNIFNDFHNPTNLAEINNDTLKIVNINDTNETNIGYITKAIVSITYYADEKIDMSIYGDLKIINNISTGNNFLTCDNWSAKIAPHTFPYIFLGTSYIQYPQMHSISHTPDDFSTGFTSKTSAKSASTNIYLPIPHLSTNINNFYLHIPSALTSITNFGL